MHKIFWETFEGRVDMSLGDVRMMMCYGRPEKVNLTYSIKFITITFLKYHFSVSPGSKNNWVYPMSPKFRRDLPTTSRLCPKVMSAYWRPLDVLRTSILNIIQNTLLFYYFRSYSPKLLLISKTSEKRPGNILKTSWKNVYRVNSLGYPQEFNIELLVQMNFNCIIFNFTWPNVCLKQQRVSCFVV